MLVDFRRIDFLLGILGRASLTRGGRRSSADFFVHEPVQSLALTIAVLHLFALGTLFIGLFLAARAAQGDRILEATLPIDGRFDDFQGAGRVVFTGQLGNNLSEDGILSEGELTDALPYRGLNVLQSSIFA